MQNSFMDNILKTPREMKKLTETEMIEYDEATTYHICKTITDKKDYKVRDHCHILGRFGGAADRNPNYNILPIG